MVELTKLMNASLGTLLNNQILYAIYDIATTSENVDADLDMYINYEGADRDPQKKLLMQIVARACIKFKAKQVLLNQPLPPPEEIIFESERIPGDINPAFKVKHVPPTP